MTICPETRKFAQSLSRSRQSCFSFSPSFSLLHFLLFFSLSHNHSSSGLIFRISVEAKDPRCCSVDAIISLCSSKKDLQRVKNQADRAKHERGKVTMSKQLGTFSCVRERDRGERERERGKRLEYRVSGFCSDFCQNDLRPTPRVLLHKS